MKNTATATLSLSVQDASSPDDAWIHLLPAGSFHGRDGRGPYLVRDIGAVIAASRRSAGRRLIPIDYEHAIDRAAPDGREAPAAGWIKGLQARADGVWGLVEWTARAAEQIVRREYRYLSPVFLHDASGKVSALLRASLVNNPNLDQLTALSSAETVMNETKTEPDVEALAALRDLLKLSPEDGLAEVLEKVRELLTSRQSASAVDPSEYVPIGDFDRVVTEVNRLNQGITLQAAQEHVAHQIRAANMPPFLRDWGVALCGVNKPAFDAFIQRTGGIFNKLTTPTVLGKPGGDSTPRLGSDELAMCARMGISEGEFLKARAFRENVRD